MTDRAYSILNPFSAVFRRCAKPLFALRYYRNFHRCIQLKNPTLYYDKVFWLSMHTDTRLWSELTDKYAVRAFVEKRCGEGVLNQLYGLYDSVDEINWDTLPQEFVLKTTNGCASNVVVRNKNNADLHQIKEKLRLWMRLRFGDLTGQPHYSRIQPRIIAEKLLIQDGDPHKALIDYKFNCFDGVVHSCAVFSDRIPNSHTFGRMIYDAEWNPHPEWLDTTSSKVRLCEVEKPESFEQMKQIAVDLSSGFKTVRVDLYQIDAKPIFGEMTFTPGLAPYTTQFQKMLGDLIDI